MTATVVPSPARALSQTVSIALIIALLPSNITNSIYHLGKSHLHAACCHGPSVSLVNESWQPRGGWDYSPACSVISAVKDGGIEKQKNAHLHIPNTILLARANRVVELNGASLFLHARLT